MVLYKNNKLVIPIGIGNHSVDVDALYEIIVQLRAQLNNN